MKTKQLLTFIFVMMALVTTSQVYGRKVYSKNTLSTGVNWGTANNWKDETGTTLTTLPLITDTVIIKDNSHLIANLVKAEVACVIIEANSSLRFGTGLTATSLPSLIINGDLIIKVGAFLYAGGSADVPNGGYLSGRSLTINGNLINDGTADLSRINSATAGTMPYENGPNVLTMGQSNAPTSISGTGTFVGTNSSVIRYLTINNSHGVTLNVSVNIPQGLNLLNQYQIINQSIINHEKILIIAVITAGILSSCKKNETTSPAEVINYSKKDGAETLATTFNVSHIKAALIRYL